MPRARKSDFAPARHGNFRPQNASLCVVYSDFPPFDVGHTEALPEAVHIFIQNTSAPPLMRRFTSFFLPLLIALVGAASAQTPQTFDRARLLFADGAYAEAAGLLEATPETALRPEGARLLGRAYQQLLQHDRAATVFARADTSDADVLADWARSLEALGRLSQAEARYRAAFRRDSTDRAVAASLARLLADRGRYEEVARIYDGLVALDPDNSYLRARLGSAYARLLMPDSAIVHYEIAHALDPENVQVVLALTKVYYDQEFYLSARRVVDRALDHQPRAPELWRRSGEIALREENYERAEDGFRQAAFYGDSAAVDLRNLGVSRYFRGRHEEAREALETSWEKEKLDAMTALYLGLAHKELDAYDEAVTFLDEAADLGGRSFVADVYSHIAATYDVRKQYDAAIRDYRLARSLDPTRPELLFHLAALYDAYYADKQAVREAYERFLAAVAEGALPQMESYARQRVLELREGQFFDEGRSAPVDTTGEGGGKGEEGRGG